MTKKFNNDGKDLRDYNLNGKITDLNEKVIHYRQRADDQALEIKRLAITSQEVLDNVNHKLRVTAGGVVNFAEKLSKSLKKYNKEQLKELSKELLKNSYRLLNMVDLAMLDTEKIELDKKIINLSELVGDRVNYCRKIYLQGKEVDFYLRIEPDILASVDPNYIRQTIDNLVINAITYSQSGTIRVSVLRKGKNLVELIVQDEGIGIPKSELFDIFSPFKTGTHTQPTEGLGVGLALCKSAVEAHGGNIEAVSNGIKGAMFRVMLPI